MESKCQEFKKWEAVWVVTGTDNYPGVVVDKAWDYGDLWLQKVLLIESGIAVTVEARKLENRDRVKGGL